MKIRNIILSLVATLSLFACSDDDESSKTANLKLGATSLTFTSQGGKDKFYLQSNCKWEVTDFPDWCTVNDTSGDATGDLAVYIYVEAEENSQTTSRSGNILINSGSESASVEIKQAGKDEVVISQDEINVTTATGGTFEVTVSGNGEEITFSVNVQWVEIEEVSDGVYSITVAGNSGYERTAEIIFTCGEAQTTLTIEQASGFVESMGSTAVELAEDMYPGVNIGNTLESTNTGGTAGGETYWGNPKVTQTYIDGLAYMGFRSVRIPCAWSCYTSGDDYTIDEEWLARVKEVVGYVINAGMYAIVNVHWDGGWLEDNTSSGYDSEIDYKQERLWTQIATYLNSFDEHLLFAGCNEPGMNESSGGSSKAAEAIVAYEQTFVDAVRATGGNNASRCLIVQGLETDISKTCESSTFKMPEDIIEDRMMLEVHYYDPYQFTLMEKDDPSWNGVVAYYWGSQNYVSGSGRNATWGEETYVAEQFDKLKSKFVDAGYPVIIGEFCAEKKTGSDVDRDKNDASREYFNEIVVQYAVDRGIVPFYWETGSDINRTTGLAKEDYAIEGIMTGAKNASFSCK